MAKIRYIYGLICLLLLIIQASSFPEFANEYMPMEIIDYVFKQHLNYCDKLNFYATSSKFHNRYKATVRQSLMQLSSQGYRLSISKILKAWKSAPHRSDLKSLLMTREDISYYEKYIFNGPIDGVDLWNFPIRAAKRYFAGSLTLHADTLDESCPIESLLASEVHPDIICILIDIYPDVMFSNWSWHLLLNCVVTEAPSKPLLESILKRFPFPVQDFEDLRVDLWYIANPEIFEMMIKNSIIKREWNKTCINCLIYAVSERFRCREPLELLLDLSPPNSIEINQRLLIDFIRFGVNVHKVSRCCYGLQYYINSTIEIPQLLIWGAEDEVFVKNVLIPYFSCCTRPDWSQKHAELAKELGYSEQFIEYANENFLPKNFLSVLFCGHLLGYTFQK